MSDTARASTSVTSIYKFFHFNDRPEFYNGKDLDLYSGETRLDSRLGKPPFLTFFFG